MATTAPWTVRCCRIPLLSTRPQLHHHTPSLGSRSMTPGLTGMLLLQCLSGRCSTSDRSMSSTSVLRQPRHLLLLTVLTILSLCSFPTALQAASSSTSSASISWSARSPLWELQPGSVPGTESLTFHWLFPQRNVDWLKQQHAERSDPHHPNYLRWLSREELQTITAALPALRRPVLDWLAAHGLTAADIDDFGDALRVRTNAATVSRLFNATLRHFRYRGSRTSSAQSSSRPVVIARVADGQLSIPPSLAASLDLLKGVADLPPRIPRVHAVPAPRRTAAHAVGTSPAFSPSPSPSPSRHSLHPMAASVGGQTNVQCPSDYTGDSEPAVSPAFLFARYNMEDRSSSTTATAVIASVAGGFGTAGVYQSIEQSDLTQYQTNVAYAATFVPTIVNASGNVWEDAANSDPPSGGSEATLDIEALYTFTPTSTNVFYTAQPDDTPYEVAVAYVAMSDASRPQIVSFSYTFGLSDLEYQSYDAGRTDTEFLKLGTLGVTVLASSGDDGTASANNPTCSDNPNSLYPGTTVTSTSGPMLPQYPASSPYVLAVSETDFMGGGGATFSGSVNSPPECNNCPVPNRDSPFICQLVAGSEQPVSITNVYGDSEQTTGGGFSSTAARPSWQSTAVSYYLNTACATGNQNGCTLPDSSFFHSGNRGYPDVSMFGGYFPIVLDGVEAVVAGTSVAAPLMAGVIARLNEVALSRAGVTLGFINPLLYSIAQSTPSAFNDLTTGDNRCTRNFTSSNCPARCVGFNAAPKWDPVTGLGSPNVGNLLSYMSTLWSASSSAAPLPVAYSSSSSAAAVPGTVLPVASSSSAAAVPTSSDGGESTTLADGAIAGIVIAALVGICAVGLLLAWLVWCCRDRDGFKRPPPPAANGIAMSDVNSWSTPAAIPPPVPASIPRYAASAYTTPPYAIPALPPRPRPAYAPAYGVTAVPYPDPYA